jgi:hypothetical protein
MDIKKRKYFNTVKERLISTSILIHFDLRKPSIVETGVSDFAQGAILSHKDDNGIQHPIAFHSRKFQWTEINYKIYDKEFIAVVNHFKVWRYYLEEALFTVMVYLDNQNM